MHILVKQWRNIHKKIMSVVSNIYHITFMILIMLPFKLVLPVYRRYSRSRIAHNDHTLEFRLDGTKINGENEASC